MNILTAEAIFYDPFGICGSIFFSQMDNRYVRVDINLENVPYGAYGIHIHQNPIKFRKNMSYEEQAGRHFNGSMPIWTPFVKGGTKHGCYMYNTERHVGDMCNNIISYGDIVSFTYYDNMISLIKSNEHYIGNRSIIIKDNHDDCGFGQDVLSNVNGNTDGCLACANIELIS